MAGKLSYERYHWFHGQVKAGNYPNARKLAKKFGVSQKQAQRDIEFIRDRLDGPLVYIPLRKGYEYGVAGFELPPIWIKEDEFLALCLALRLASALPDKNLKRSLYKLLEKFLSFRFLDSPPRLSDIEEKISVKNIEYYKVDETIFHRIVGGLFQNEPVKISYYTPHKDEMTERVIRPLHLLCYMGSWHIIAYCHLRNDLRDFALSRIRSIEPASETIDSLSFLPSIKDYIRKNFGLMSGGESLEVCLRFTTEVSNWVSEQVWHPAQEMTRQEDGSICLTFPVADFREVRREILKYGAAVEVISPPQLRDEIQKEIARMIKIYG